MKRLRLKIARIAVIPVVLAIPFVIFIKSFTSSSSWIGLKDQAKIERILLHNKKGEHACHCFPPMIATNPGFVISDITSTSANFRWVCDNAATYQVNYGTSASKGTRFPATKPTATYKDYTVKVTGLKPSTLYHAGPYSQVSGRSDYKAWLMSDNTKSDWTFTTGPVGIKFSIYGIIRSVEDSTVGLSGVSVTLSGDSSCRTTSMIDGAYGFSGLTGGKRYTITPSKANYTFTPTNKMYSPLTVDQKDQNYIGQAVTSVVRDRGEHLYSISQVTASKITATEASIRWKTNFRSTSQVEYGTTNKYGLKSGENTELSSDHYIQVFDLTPGATYYYKVISRSSAGMPFSATDFTFETEPFEKRIADKSSYFAHPNPCYNGVEFNYYLYQPIDNLNIDILSLSGKKVAVLKAPKSALAAGWNRISWDVKDHSGTPLINGLYVYKMIFTKGNAEESFKSARLSVRR
jgi:hypothetical protein